MPITGLVGCGDETSWRLWWEHNRDPYLGLRDSVRESQQSYGSTDFYIGKRAGETGEDLGVREDQVLSEVAPALVAALRDQGSAAMRRRALLSIAKLPASYCEKESLDRYTILKTYLGDPDSEVSKTAAIGLGLIGGADALDTLEHLLMGCDVGQKLMRRSHIPYTMRINAAYAMGLAGARSEIEEEKRFVLHFLSQAMKVDRSGSPDVASACVAAIGVIAMPVRGVSLADASREPLLAGRESQVAALLAILEDKDERRITRAHTVTAIGRLLSAEGGDQIVDYDVVVRKLARILSSRAGYEREVRQSAALALGMVADSDNDVSDKLARKALTRSTADTDQLTRFFAMVALGQAAGRVGENGGEGLAGSHAARKHLLGILAKGKSGSRPWAALGLGLLGHGINEGGYYPSGDASRALADLLRSTKRPETVGALAISLGLRGAGQYRALVEERLESIKRDDATTSELALALGMIGAMNSEGALRELSDTASRRPHLLREVAIARALLGDQELISDLLDDLEEADTLASLVGVASSLAFVGEKSTITPLSLALKGESATSLGRAYLLEALGDICDEGKLPWTTTYSIGVNYGAATETLEKGASEGLLNMD